MASTKKTGVCLLYMGGPETLAQVEPFLLRLFSDRRLIRLPGGSLLQRPLARLISHRRAPRVAERYRRMGGGSPLVRITRRQAQLLQQSLGEDFAVSVGMRYSDPRVDVALAELSAHPISRLVALPLYPHYSGATTGSSFDDLDRALATRPEAGAWEVVRVDSFHDHPLYVQALTGIVQRALEQLGHDATVIFSAHSLPLKLVQRGDPYRDQVERTVQLVAQLAGLQRFELGYQSRSGPVRWLEPNVLDLVARHARRGTPALLVVPISFVSDHIETLHEIDIEMRDFALKRGITRFLRAPALNEDPVFIEALTHITRAA